MQSDHLIRGVGLRLVVSGQDDRRTFGACLIDGSTDERDRLGVDSRQRFVEEKQGCVLGQSLGDKRTLPLATGESAEAAVGKIGDVQPVEAVRDDPPIRGAEAPEETRPPPPAHLDRLSDGDRQMVGSGAALGHECDIRRSAHDRSGAGAEQSGQGHEYSRLAGAVMADEGDDRPDRNVQVDGVDGEKPAVVAGQARDVDSGRRFVHVIIITVIII